jgi:hypothetical protein
MIARTHKLSTRSGPGTGRIVSRKAEIDSMFDRIKSLSDDHFGYGPDAVTWSHVGSLDHHAELLKRITDSAFKEGEHAA